MPNHESVLSAYEVDVLYPEVSGMEHLDMLLTRSHLAHLESELTLEQQARLHQADLVLLCHAQQFFTAISQIANLKSWRDQEQAPPEHWWWYLDVLAAAPMASEALPELIAV